MKLKQYILESQPIGVGHYGIVYRATDPIEDRTVAIKKINVDDGKKEAEIIKKAGISSLFLPKYYDFFIIDESGYIVMEYLDGKKLGAGFHNQIEKWEEKKAVQTGINILKAIKPIHEMGFIHNDIMPKNIMVKDHNPELTKVYDFNRAKKIDNHNMVLKDLRNTAEVCFVMLDGMLPKKIAGTELKNKELMDVLLKAIFPTELNQYESAYEFISALKPFR